MSLLDNLRIYKFKNTSLFDYIMTIISAFVLTYYTEIPLTLTTIFVFVLGILAHYMFNIDTSTTKYLKKIT